jgi:hypothetical protein
MSVCNVGHKLAWTWRRLYQLKLILLLCNIITVSEFERICTMFTELKLCQIIVLLLWTNFRQFYSRKLQLFLSYFAKYPNKIKKFHNNFYLCLYTFGAFSSDVL